MTIHRLKTAHGNRPLIIDGAKTATVRYGYENKVRPGDRFELVDAETGDVIATRTVEMSAETTVRRAPELIRDFGFHYPHTKPMKLTGVLSGHYPEVDFTVDTDVDVFGYAGPDDAEPYTRGGGGRA